MQALEIGGNHGVNHSNVPQESPYLLQPFVIQQAVGGGCHHMEQRHHQGFCLVPLTVGHGLKDFCVGGNKYLSCPCSRCSDRWPPLPGCILQTQLLQLGDHLPCDQPRALYQVTQGLQVINKRDDVTRNVLDSSVPFHDPRLGWVIGRFTW